MRGEKTKTPGKEFAAQVSDYVPSPRRKTKEQTEPVFDTNSVNDQNLRQNKKPERPWSLPNHSGMSSPPSPGITAHKPDTNWLQTGHKPNTQPDTNRAQTGHNVSEKAERILQTGHKPDTQPDTTLDTNRTQTGYKPDTKSVFTQLVGLQRKVLLFIYRSCQIARSRTTEPLALEHIAKSLNIRTGSVKTTLRRLEEKELIFRSYFKNGRGGWSRYELAAHVFAAVLQLETEHKLDTNWTQTEHKLDTQPDTQPDTSPSSSSSSIRSIDLVTTTSETILAPPRELEAQWQVIDCSPLTELRFGRGQIAQIAHSGRVTSEELQESIYAFAFDLTENQKAKNISGAPLNYFMGILRKGPYTPPVNYESPEDRQQRLYLEAKEQQRKLRLDRESRLETVEFEEWAEKLSLDQRAELVPPKDYAKPGGTAHTMQLREYFRENVWPDVRNRIAHESQLNLAHEGIGNQ